MYDSWQTIDEIVQLHECFVRNGVKPVIMRVLREIRDEFGLEYYLIVDENNRRRRIQKSIGIPKRSSFMIPAHGGFAPESFITVTQYW